MPYQRRNKRKGENTEQYGSVVAQPYAELFRSLRLHAGDDIQHYKKRNYQHERKRKSLHKRKAVDNKAGHILEMLCDSKDIITCKDVDLVYINKHLNLVMYNHEKYNIRDIKVYNIDNIDCVVKVSYEYIEKINEDRDDITYTSSYTNIDFIDNPDILRK